MVFNVGCYHAARDGRIFLMVFNVGCYLEADVYLSHFKEDLYYYIMQVGTHPLCFANYILLHLHRSEDHIFERQDCIVYTCVHALCCLTTFYDFILQIFIEGAEFLPRDIHITLMKLKTIIVLEILIPFREVS